jgi:hypothetical protein
LLSLYGARSALTLVSIQRSALSLQLKATLFNFFVRGVLAALTTELVEFQTLGRGLLVLGRRVVPVFAITAL